MGRAPCCEKVGLKRGRWTAEEDELLRKYIEANGEGSWRSLPKNAGLLRCGKSCRLRWINYLRSDVKRGDISADEEDIIINLHSSLGNRWSLIAGHLPGRTDNEIKNYWNSHLSRKIQSFRKPNTNFVIPPPLVKANRRTGCRTTSRPPIINKKKKKNNKMQMDTTTTAAATTKQIEENMTSNVINGAASNSNGEVPLTMPTTPTPEKEALCSSSVMPTVPEEGLMKVGISAATAETENTSLVLPLDEGNVRICQGIGTENAILCLDNILEDLNGIWGFDEDKDSGGIATSGDDKKNTVLGGMEDSSRRQECNSGMNNGNYCDTEEWNLMRSPALNSWEWDWDDVGATGNGNHQEENTFSWFWDADHANNDSDWGCDKHTATMLSWLHS